MGLLSLVHVFASAAHFAVTGAFHVSSTIVGMPLVDKSIVVELQVQLAHPIAMEKLPAYCGIFVFEENLEYKVQRVISGIYPDSTVNIVQQCPREAVEQKWIEYGKSYIFRLSPRYVNGSKGEKKYSGNYEIVDE